MSYNKIHFSVLIPVKDSSKYIIDALSFLQKIPKNIDFEVIVVDDNSTDNTYSIVSELSKIHKEIILLKNDSTGKISALNLASRICTGDYIRFVDSDDVFDVLKFCKHFPYADYPEVVLNPMVIVDTNLSPISNYFINVDYLHKNIDTCIQNMISLPRCSFTLRKDLFHKVFPLPKEVEYEDIWISLVCKLSVIKFHMINDPSIYLYRQHDTQAYGGVMNFKPDMLNIRAHNVIKSIEYLQSTALFYEYKDSFMVARDYYNLLLYFSWNGLFRIQISLRHKFKLLLLLKFNSFSSLALRIKWLFDKHSL